MTRKCREGIFGDAGKPHFQGAYTAGAVTATVAEVAAGGCGLYKAAGKKAGKECLEGIYEFTDTTGKTYVGQSGNIPRRIEQHIASGKLDPNATVKTTGVKGGKTAREIEEHKRIQEITGGVPARFSNKVSNRRDPIGPSRRHLIK